MFQVQQQLKLPSQQHIAKHVFPLPQYPQLDM